MIETLSKKIIKIKLILFYLNNCIIFLSSILKVMDSVVPCTTSLGVLLIESLQARTHVMRIM